MESERLYLSGTGPEAPRGWEFRIDSGRRARKWRVIPVPSNWELEGYGRYTHGRQWWRPAEKAVYRTQFTVPPRFDSRRVELVFEGVMTDAEVLLNGWPAGDVHRGGYTRFAYEISSLLLYDRPNRLEVRVAEASFDPSVNRAEREADYWTFGGIYRPVYLEAHPATSIRHLGVDGRHDGRLTVDIEAVATEPAEVVLQVTTLDGEPVGDSLRAALGEDGAARVEGVVAGVRSWSAESPDLYRLDAELIRPDGSLLHRRSLRIGFRSVELRPGVGLFVNDRRILLKGVNRHSHWPDTGRSVAAAINRRDVELIRSMNMNAVRTAHSPPDPEFLDACDEIGLYVIDELPGWHDAYDTEVGSGLLEEMIRRDVNHPSVILWANGNEGGWNTELDPLFTELDPQRRPVLHPGERALGFEASHYPDWEELQRMVDGSGQAAAGEPAAVLLPTEILHALYDGGGGASLQEYWGRLLSSGRLAGMFLWSLFDEGVVRTDKEGRVDTSGNRGADGLLGPHRQPEASFYAVREIWSPVALVATQFAPEAVEIELENRFDETDLADCFLGWRWLELPELPIDGAIRTVTEGERPLPTAGPGERAVVRLARPEERSADAIELRALTADGRELMTWVVADELVAEDTRPALERWRQAEAVSGSDIRQEREGSRLTLRAPGGHWVRLDMETAELIELGYREHRLRLSGGAWRADGSRARLDGIEIGEEAGAVAVRARFQGALEQLVWRLHGDGWLRLDYGYRAEGDPDFLGVGFDYPRDLVRSLAWLGNGPHRVWRNRLAGGRLGLWRTASNDTVTGAEWRYPEFPGIYSGLRWASLDTAEGTLTLVPDAGLYLGLFAPRFPRDARTAVAEVPSGITLLHRIPAIGSKFHRPQELGPDAERRGTDGTLRGGAWLRFPGGVAASP